MIKGMPNVCEGCSVYHPGGVTRCEGEFTIRPFNKTGEEEMKWDLST